LWTYLCNGWQSFYDDVGENIDDLDVACAFPSRDHGTTWTFEPRYLLVDAKLTDTSVPPWWLASSRVRVVA
jgi:hypothetical protein